MLHFVCEFIDLRKIKNIADSGKKIRLGFRYAPDLGLPENASYQKSSHKLGSQKEDPLFSEFFTFLTLKKYNIHFELLHTHFAINNRSSGIYSHVLHDLYHTLKYVLERWPTVKLPEKISLGGGFHPYSPETVGEATAYKFTNEVQHRRKVLRWDRAMYRLPMKSGV